MSVHPRNEPCPCGSGVKYKRCCIGREAELARRAEAAQELFLLAAAFPLLRPADEALEAWAETLAGAGVTRELIEEGVVRAGDRECERIADWCAEHYPELWAGLTADFGDEDEAGPLVVVGAVAEFLAEARFPEEGRLEHVEECPDCSADDAVALAGVLEACDLWSVAEAATLHEILTAAGQELDEARFEVVIDAASAAFWTDAHAQRLALLVGRVRRRLPQRDWPRASKVLAAACSRFERDEGVRARVAGLLLADALGQFPAVALGLSAAA